MASMFGGTVDPKLISPTVGTQTQTNFFNALFGQGLQNNPQGGGMQFAGVQPYGGQLSPDVNSTRLPDVYNSWQPWNAGLSYMASALTPGQGNSLPIGQNDPNLSMLMSKGGTGGPGSRGIQDTMQGGTPSHGALGQWMNNLAQYGSAGPAGVPLANLAQGFASGPAAWLNPFLMKGAGTPYKAPSIPQTTVSRVQ